MRIREIQMVFLIGIFVALLDAYALLQVTKLMPLIL
jgi:hypothetical protein